MLQCSEVDLKLRVYFALFGNRFKVAVRMLHYTEVNFKLLCVCCTVRM